MKILVALNIVQTGCLLFLVALLVGEEGNLPASSTETPSVATSASDFTTYAQSDKTAQTMNEAALRQIVREELAAFNNTASSEPARTATSQRSSEDNRYQREYVSDQIDYYSSVGEISPAQMHQLQREIAELDDAGRREMLSKLTRAMNARQIKGQL